MTKKLKKIYPYITYFIMLAAFTAIYYLLPHIGDDTVNDKDPRLKSLAGIYSQNADMWENWTSRILINPWMYISTNLIPKIVYAFITAVVTICAFYYISRKYKDHPKIFFATIMTGLLIPFMEFSTAGYIATLVTYLYPIGLLCLGLTLLEHDNVILKLLSVICFLLAFNNEQLCVLAGAYLCYYIFKHYKDWQSYLYVAVPFIFDFALAVLSPGNRNRKSIDTDRWLPAFKHYNLFDKIDTGAITTIQHYLFSVSIPLITLAVILLILNYKKHPIMSWVPTITIGFTSGISMMLTDAKKYVATPNPKITTTVLVTYAIGIVLFASIIYLLNNWNLSALLIAGIISRILLGFSPTIYVSSTRTFVFCDCVIIYLILYLITHHKWENEFTPIMILIMPVGFNLLINYCMITGHAFINFGAFPWSLWYTLIKS